MHGLRDSVKCKKVLSFLNIFAFDIVLLQETYLGSSDIKAFKSIWKGPVFYSVAFSNHSCGVIIAFSSKLPCTYSQVRFDNEGRYVSVLCSFNNNVSFRICNIYAPCDPAKRVAHDAAIVFNEGESARLNLFEELKYGAGKHTKNFFIKKDHRRIKRAKQASTKKGKGLEETKETETDRTAQ